MWVSLARLLRVQAPRVLHRTTMNQNYVMNEVLAQLEHACEVPCIPNVIPERKVTVIGAGSSIGQIVCLLLKQSSLIRYLAMYDENPQHNVIGAATDLAHIDTSPAVEAYQGRKYMGLALHGADVVVICGGYYPIPPDCCVLDRDLFEKNTQYVRTAALAIANFCPKATIALQTPPVDSTFALVKWTLKANHVYDKRKLLGLNTINSMRANQIFANAVGINPMSSYIPIVGGTGRCSSVPIFSNTTHFWCLSEDDKDFIQRMITSGDELICRVKCNNETAHLSTGFATARAVLGILTGKFVAPTFVDCVLVDQDDPDMVFGLETCCTPVTMGVDGVQRYEIPKLSNAERAGMHSAMINLEDALNLGKCAALGTTYYLHPDKEPIVPKLIPCPTCDELIRTEREQANKKARRKA